MDLRKLNDKNLLSQTKKLIAIERNCITQVLYHLKEIEERRLFSDLRFSSLFEYAVKELGYSEAAANRRIHCARLLKLIPELGEKFENGSMNLTNVTMASQLFKGEKIRDLKTKKIILSKIENKTKKDCEQILMHFREVTLLPREGTRRVSVDTHTFSVNIGDKTLQKLENLKCLLGHHHLSGEGLLDYMIDAATVKAEKQKSKVLVNKTEAATAPAQSGEEKRVPVAALKRAVYTRDKGKCTICGSNYKLEYDHVKPWALGGKTQEQNLRLLCFSCNQRQRIKAGLQTPQNLNSG